MQNKIVKIFVFLILFILVCFFPQDVLATNDKKPEEKDNGLKLRLEVKDTVCRSRSPIMTEIIFENTSVKTQKICTYMFYDSLIKLDVRDAKGEKVKFTPKLLQAGKIKHDDWVSIQPGRSFKRKFSLSKKIMDSTGRRLLPGNYSIRVIYDGCSKFDPALPEEKFTSNWFYLLITD